MISTTMRLRTKGMAACALAAIVGLVFSSASNAAPINYGDFVAADVTYTDVTEVSTTDPEPLYGSPITAGNQLQFFHPSAAVPSLGFGASAGGGSVDTTDGTLLFGLSAHPGFGISSITVSEGGDYSLAALGAALAKVTARMPVFEVNVTHVDGAPITPFSLSSAPIPIVTYELPGDPEVGIWNLSDFFDLDQELVDRSIPFVLGVTELTVKVDNTLIALSAPGSAALIVKKAFNVDVETKVPEPSAFILFAATAVGVGLAARRQRVG
jgi:hypothetical protein